MKIKAPWSLLPESVVGFLMPLIDIFKHYSTTSKQYLKLNLQFSFETQACQEILFIIVVILLILTSKKSPHQSAVGVPTEKKILSVI